jgi:hypothetical protein
MRKPDWMSDEHWREYQRRLHGYWHSLDEEYEALEFLRALPHVDPEGEPFDLVPDDEQFQI